MSRINFDILQNERPDLADVWARLRTWLSGHPHARFLEVHRLSSELPEIEEIDLFRALTVLKNKGYARQVYRLRDPHGVQLPTDYRSLEDIPEEVPDQFHRSYFRSSEGDIVTGMKLEQECDAS
jgi:hypothetical protein